MPAIAAIDNETLDHLWINVGESQRTLAVPESLDVIGTDVRVCSFAVARLCL
jgi:hypothetical protein